VKHIEKLNPSTPSEVAIQKIGLLVVKAGLSSIPLASLAFDFGQVFVDAANERAKASVNLANQKITLRFLEELAGRVEQLESMTNSPFSSDGTHQIAADSALRSLVSETNERVAEILARAVALLANMPRHAIYKAQCARVISELTEPMLHAIQTNDRIHRNLLAVDELKICSRFEEKSQQVAALLNSTMVLPDWDPVMRRIMDIGLIDQIIDAGHFGDDTPMVQTAPTTEYGRVIINLCFEDVAIPQFGTFAI
jgi:hypothetical protein